MKYSPAVLAILLQLFCAASLAAPPQNLQDLQQTIKTIQEETGVPSIGVALVDSNGPIWVSAIGYADVERQIPANADTIYRMGSVSKLFTGLAIMRVVEDGHLSLNDRLADVAPEFIFENRWEETNPIRIAHLLEHTTGWDVQFGEYFGEASDSTSIEDALNRHSDARVSRWVPGTRQAYSNTGPVVAALLVEKVTGMRFDEYVQRHVFAPLAMDSSAFVKTAEFEERGATGYTPEGPTPYRYFHTRPSSSLNASPRDLASFLGMLTNRGAVGRQQFLSAEAIRRMQNSETTLGAKAGMHAGYGLTLDVSGFENRQTPFYGHTGGIPGGVAEVIYQPTLKMGYAFTINQADPEAFGRVSQALRSYLLKDQEPLEIAAQPLPEEFRALSGFYAPVNPLSTSLQAFTDVTDVMRFETNALFLHRSPFFGGWTSQEYLPEGAKANVLVSGWSGLPTVAIVEDPLVGQAIQVEGMLYQEVSALSVYSRLFLLALSLVLIAGSVLYLAVLLLLHLLPGRKDKSINQAHLVLAAPGLLLLAVPCFFVVSASDPALIMESLPVSVFIFLVSLLYPIAVAYAVWLLCSARDKKASRSGCWYLVTVTSAHVFITVYLGFYGLLAFRVWA